MPTFDFAGSAFAGSDFVGADFAGATTLERPDTTLSGTERTAGALAATRRGITLVQLHDELWRVTRSSGEVLGYVESFLEPRGRRYRSKRLLALQKRFLPIGEFWSFDDAVDCLRFG